MLGTLLAFVTGVLVMITGARAAQGHQLNTAMRKCDCVCRPIGGVYPWVVEDLRANLTRGEKLKAYNWFMGPIVCLRPDEPAVDDRFDELQLLVDEGERTRLHAREYQ